MYDCTSGKILINGRDIKEYDAESIRKSFSVMMQDSVLFPESIGDNICISDENCDRNRFDRAVYCSDVTLLQNKVSLSTKLFRLFDSKGYEPSKGEYQKICMARALYKKADFLVLDEPTSALDSFSEQRILKNLYENAEEKTVIYTAHRLTTVSYATRIIVIDKGTVAEDGTFDELMNLQGLFYNMYNGQIGDAVR